MVKLPWRQYEQRLDATVDGQWFEPCELHPYVIDPNTSQPTADPTRPVRKNIIVVMMRPGAAATGEGAIMGGQFRTQQATSEVWLSVRDDQLGLPTDWKPDDRVFMNDRAANGEQGWYEVAWVAPSATGRWDVHLTILEPGG